MSDIPYLETDCAAMGGLDSAQDKLQWPEQGMNPVSSRYFGPYKLVSVTSRSESD